MRARDVVGRVRGEGSWSKRGTSIANISLRPPLSISNSQHIHHIDARHWEAITNGRLHPVAVVILTSTEHELAWADRHSIKSNRHQAA